MLSVFFLLNFEQTSQYMYTKCFFLHRAWADLYVFRQPGIFLFFFFVPPWLSTTSFSISAPSAAVAAEAVKTLGPTLVKEALSVVAWKNNFLSPDKGRKTPSGAMFVSTLFFFFFTFFLLPLIVHPSALFHNYVVCPHSQGALGTKNWHAGVRRRDQTYQHFYFFTQKILLGIF